MCPISSSLQSCFITAVLALETFRLLYLLGFNLSIIHNGFDGKLVRVAPVTGLLSWLPGALDAAPLVRVLLSLGTRFPGSSELSLQGLKPAPSPQVPGTFLPGTGVQRPRALGSEVGVQGRVGHVPAPVTPLWPAPPSAPCLPITEALDPLASYAHPVLARGRVMTLAGQAQTPEAAAWSPWVLRRAGGTGPSGDEAGGQRAARPGNTSRRGRHTGANVSVPSSLPEFTPLTVSLPPLSMGPSKYPLPTKRVHGPRPGGE